MSLVHLANVCSHLQNASHLRLGLTSIPYTKLHLSLSLLLQKQGFLSQVKVAGPAPPASCFPPGMRDNYGVTAHPQSERILSAQEAALNDSVTRKMDREQLVAAGHSEEAIEFAEKNRHLTPRQLAEQGVDLDVMGLKVEQQPVNLIEEQHRDTHDYEAEGVVTQANRASRRLWLGLKYWDGSPVLRKARMLSKPTKRIWLNSQELGRVARGGQAGEIRGLTRIGEIMAVSTDRGILEARECVERRIGGQVLCRVY